MSESFETIGITNTDIEDDDPLALSSDFAPSPDAKIVSNA